LLGSGEYPDPVEYLLHAVTACVTDAIVYHAAAKGIQIQEIESRTEGEVDLRGFLGLDNNIRPAKDPHQVQNQSGRAGQEIRRALPARSKVFARSLTPLHARRRLK